MRKQLVVAAGFDDEAVLDDEDAVGMHDRRQSVGDDDRGAALAEFGDRLLHVVLGFGIERRGRLVEQDDRRILDQRARDGDALALPAGELQAVLADRGIVAIREVRDEIVRVRRLGGGDDLRLAGAEFSERDVVADATAEQVGDLADIGDGVAQ